MIRTAAVCALLATSSCAWVFQDRLPERYSKASPPRCSTSKGLVALDGIFGVLNGISALALMSIPRTPQDDVLLGSSILWTVIHTASGLSGSSWADQCRRAQDTYDENEEQEDRDERLERRAIIAVPAATHTPVPPAEPQRSIAPQETTPRGFYCATSTTQLLAGVCARDKDVCIQLSAALAVAVTDMAACQLVETAACFDAGSGDADERCAPTLDACAAQRARAIAAGAAPSRMGRCMETR